jgi:hypothetical protein
MVRNIYPNGAMIYPPGLPTMAHTCSKTVLNEFYRVAFRKKVYSSIDELQADLDVGVCEYNAATSRALVLRQDADTNVP